MHSVRVLGLNVVRSVDLVPIIGHSSCSYVGHDYFILLDLPQICFHAQVSFIKGKLWAHNLLIDKSPSSTNYLAVSALVVVNLSSAILSIVYQMKVRLKPLEGDANKFGN